MKTEVETSVASRSKLSLHCNVRHLDPSDYVDISRGARLHGIANTALFIEAKLLDDYAELDAGLGQNLVGVILSVLGHHLSLNPGGTHNDKISVCSIRREDVRVVEVDLGIERRRVRGCETIILTKIAERDSDVDFV